MDSIWITSYYIVQVLKKPRMKGLVSVIIPTKNASRHLKSLLTSLQKQTYKNIEVVINDDKVTTDDTEKVVRSFKGVKVIYLKENKSMAQGRAVGAKRAKGDYLLHIDADMILGPRVVESCVKKSDQYDAIIIPEVSFGEGYWAKVRVFERSLYVGDDTMESARFFSRGAYNSVGGHNKDMVLSEDKDLDLRIREAGFKVGRIKEPIYHNEGKLSIWKDMRKKFFYGKTARVFISQHPEHSLKQGNLIFRAAYFRNWKKIVSHPILSWGMFTMKYCEMLAALCGLISSRKVNKTT